MSEAFLRLSPQLDSARERLAQELQACAQALYLASATELHDLVRATCMATLREIFATGPTIPTREVPNIPMRVSERLQAELLQLAARALEALARTEKSFAQNVKVQNNSLD